MVLQIFHVVLHSLDLTVSVQQHFRLTKVIISGLSHDRTEADLLKHFMCRKVCLYDLLSRDYISSPPVTGAYSVALATTDT